MSAQCPRYPQSGHCGRVMSATCQKLTSRRFTCPSLKIERELELPHDHLVQCQRKGSVMYRSTSRAEKVHTLPSARPPIEHHPDIVLPAHSVIAPQMIAVP